MKQTLKSLLLCAAVAAAMLLSACGEKAPDSPEIDTGTVTDSEEALQTQPTDDTEASTDVSSEPVTEPTVDEPVTEPVDEPTVDEPDSEVPDEELRYDVKEVLFYGALWSNSDLEYPNDAVQLSNAQINKLFDMLLELELTEENKGFDPTGGIPIWCTVDTGDEKYCFDFNCYSLIIWPTAEGAHTITDRYSRVVYNFPDDPIFDYVEEVYNEVRPDGIAPIF